jgi:signal transduction histidine kinase
MATAILKSLIHFSRQTDQQNESCHIHKILDNCLLMLNNRLKHRIVIEKDYTDDSVIIQGNEGRLHQAFLNILSNAEQAIQGEGTIRLETKVSNGVISIAIADTGCGIPYENLSRIRDPFFTTKAPGVGTFNNL